MDREDNVPGAARLPIVAIVASAGGLTAISTILAGLPQTFAAPLVVVQHLTPDKPSLMAEILARRTTLHVEQACEGVRLIPGHVYVAPPDKHLLANRDHTLSLSDSPRVRNVRPAGDVLFASVAAAFGARAIGVVLTGYDGDGSAGIKAIREAGGRTIAQDEASSQQFSMPRSAIKTGDVDMILPIEDIAQALMSLVAMAE